jgi:hypothetical protein
MFEHQRDEPGEHHGSDIGDRDEAKDGGRQVDEPLRWGTGRGRSMPVFRPGVAVLGEVRREDLLYQLKAGQRAASGRPLAGDDTTVTGNPPHPPAEEPEADRLDLRDNDPDARVNDPSSY